MEKIRILDLGKIPALRSQTIYHAVAYAMKEDTPDTIILVSPETPYACIGLHQELAKEVDLEYCRSVGLPVYRRETGGGAVYLDDGQVFVQWIFHKGRLPTSVEERYVMYIKPLVETYKAFGINANHRPVNDIHVNGKKIGGTGAAEIGIADVVVGSLMFDFDKVIMSKILKVSSEKMRDKIFQSLEEYMTTMKEQLGGLPSRESVIQAYLRECRAVLNTECCLGTASEEENVAAMELDKRFVTDEWLDQKTGRAEMGIKIHEDVRLYESVVKAPGGLIRVTLRVLGNSIDDLTISGDFTILPANAVKKIETGLIGVELSENKIFQVVGKILDGKNVQSPGLSPENIRDAIFQAIDKDGPR